jgi:hypothetical protein
MRKDPKPFLNRDFTYAVVGATPNREKYGNVVFRDLLDNGLKAIGVNPKHKTVEGQPVYPTLAGIPETPDVAVVVIPPAAGLSVLDDAKKAGVKMVWFQPGAESEEIRERAQQLGLDAMANGACIMVERRNHEL